MEENKEQNKKLEEQNIIEEQYTTKKINECIKKEEEKLKEWLIKSGGGYIARVCIKILNINEKKNDVYEVPIGIAKYEKETNLRDIIDPIIQQICEHTKYICAFCGKKKSQKVKTYYTDSWKERFYIIVAPICNRKTCSSKATTWIDMLPQLETDQKKEIEQKEKEKDHTV